MIFLAVIGIIIAMAVGEHLWWLWTAPCPLTPEKMELTLLRMFAKEIADRELLVHLCEQDLIVRCYGESIRWPKTKLYGTIDGGAVADCLREIHQMRARSRARTGLQRTTIRT